MLNFGEVYEIDKFLTEEEYDLATSCFYDSNNNWTFNAGEEYRRREGTPVRTFWYKELSGTVIEDIFTKKIESILNSKITIQRIYGNGQAHGQSTWVHVDDNDEENISGSLVYYIHRNWRPYFGGHLIFVDDDELEVLKSIFPKTNSAVMFNSLMKHMALEPTVYCLEQRESIAVKFKVLQ